jgi:hypothetical protein
MAAADAKHAERRNYPHRAGIFDGSIYNATIEEVILLTLSRIAIRLRFVGTACRHRAFAFLVCGRLSKRLARPEQ